MSAAGITVTQPTDYTFNNAHRASDFSPEKFVMLDEQQKPNFPDFYAVLKQHKGTREQRAALDRLDKMDETARARLPLFAGACDEYFQSVISARLTAPGISATTHQDAFMYVFSAIKNMELPLTTREAWIKIKDDANLKGSFQNMTNLAGKNLSGFNLEGLDLQGSDLSGADLTNANLNGTNLTNTNVTNTNFQYAKYDAATVLPPTIDPQHFHMSRTDLIVAFSESAHALWDSVNRFFR